MKSKKDLALEFIKNNIGMFRCPICFSDFECYDQFITCNKKHNFDFNKKGTLCLLNSYNLKKSEIYCEELFVRRREFIEKGFFQHVHTEINKIIKNYFKNKKINVLDIGSGEGTHVKKILGSDYNTLIGLDYSKVAINLATSFYSDKDYYFIGDVNNLPFKEKSIDCIIDFLSPYNEIEVKRVIKNDGLFIKVVPGDNYLKELRESLNMKDYEHNNLLKIKHKYVREFEVSKSYSITKDDLSQLIQMTPIRKNDVNVTIDKITINMIIYVVEGRDYFEKI